MQADATRCGGIQLTVYLKKTLIEFRPGHVTTVVGVVPESDPTAESVRERPSESDLSLWISLVCVERTGSMVEVMRMVANK